MRGKAQAAPAPQYTAGITPAYAGKSVFGWSIRSRHRDHPRLCGEKFMPADVIANVRGSPPPMRGKEADGETFEAVLRITPAYAGKR